MNASANFGQLMIAFAKRFDPAQARQISVLIRIQTDRMHIIA